MRTAYGREQMTRRSASRTARPRGGSPDGAIRLPDHGGRCGAIGSRPAPERRRAGDGPLVTPSPAVSVSTAAPYGRVCRAHTPATAVVRRCPPATSSSGSRGRPGGRGTAGTAGRRCRGRSASGWPTARTAPRPTAGPDTGGAVGPRLERAVAVEPPARRPGRRPRRRHGCVVPFVLSASSPRSGPSSRPSYAPGEPRRCSRRSGRLRASSARADFRATATARLLGRPDGRVDAVGGS